VVEGDKIVGAIWPEDVIQRYNAEIFKRDMASSMAKTIEKEPGGVGIPGVENMSLAEIPVPSRYVGRSLAELDLRNRFNATVLLVKQKRGDKEKVLSKTPGAETILRQDDVLLLLGPPSDLARFERE
jgi:K+/H+ antiporter YhaU regulatory subunit KhtT